MFLWIWFIVGAETRQIRYCPSLHTKSLEYFPRDKTAWRTTVSQRLLYTCLYLKLWEFLKLPTNAVACDSPWNQWVSICTTTYTIVQWKCASWKVISALHKWWHTAGLNHADWCLATVYLSGIARENGAAWCSGKERLPPGSYIAWSLLFCWRRMSRGFPESFQVKTLFVTILLFHPGDITVTGLHTLSNKIIPLRCTLEAFWASLSSQNTSYHKVNHIWNKNTLEHKRSCPCEGHEGMWREWRYSSINGRQTPKYDGFSIIIGQPSIQQLEVSITGQDTITDMVCCLFCWLVCSTMLWATQTVQRRMVEV